MCARMAADLVVVLHLLFIAFVAAGGFLSLRHRAWGVVHLPAVAWAAMIECRGWVCPLTPLENWLRRQGGRMTYDEGFVEHYLVPVVYPAGLTRRTQVALGTFLIAANAGLYLWLFFRERRKGGATTLR